MNANTERLRRFISLVVVFTAGAIALAPPLITLTLEFVAARSTIESQTAQQAILLGRTISRYPEVWKFTVERLEETLQGIRDPESHLLLVDNRGHTVLELGAAPRGPVVESRQPVTAFSGVVGQLTARHGLEPAMTTTAQVAALSVGAAALVLVMFFRLRRRETELSAAQLADAVEAAGDFAAVVREAMDPVMLIDPDSEKLLDFNDAACALTAYPRDALLGLTVGDIAPECAAALKKLPLRKTGPDQRHAFEAMVLTRNGEKLHARIGVRTVMRRGKPTLATIWTDITELHHQKNQLERLAHYDTLTQLPNRALLADRIERALARAKRNGKLLAVAIIDLDEFKPINDTHGHAIGDEVLIEVARRLGQAVRGEDTVARLGGDEFVVLLVDVESAASAVQGYQRIIRLIEEPVRLPEHEFKISASVGVTLYPSDQGDVDQLLRHADQAMYEVKMSGRNGVRVFDAEDERARRHTGHQLEEIRAGLGRGEFRLHYQPKVNMRSGRVYGAEALLRWQHPEHGLLPPGRFLAAVEDSPLAVPLGSWVIAETARQIGVWKRAGVDIRVSLNVFAEQLQDPDFADILKNALYGNPGVSPSQLEIEIVETEALKNIEEINRVIAECRAIGIEFAIDDFGTGYSSLAYLRRLSAQTLKIDQSFVRGMLHSVEDRAITDGIIRLAEAFGREVIAEGVEHPQHGLGLLVLGCENAQGYGIARPMPGDQFVEWMRNYQPPASWLDPPLGLARADFDLLAIELDYETRHARFAKVFQSGDLLSAPELAVDDSMFALQDWIRVAGARRYGHLPQFDRIAALHREIVSRSGHFVDYVLAGNAERSRAEFAHLDGLQLALRQAFAELRQQRSGELPAARR